MNSSFYNYLISRESREYCRISIHKSGTKLSIIRSFPNYEIFWTKRFIDSTIYNLVINFKTYVSYSFTIRMRYKSYTVCYKDLTIKILPKRGHIKIKCKYISEDRNEAVELFEKYLKYSDSIR